MDKSTYNKICFGHSFDRIVDNLALKIEQNAVDHIVYSTSKSDIRFPRQIYWAVLQHNYFYILVAYKNDF